MSITINGATNTLTAAAGLTVAGNTAVTGTLSATGNITGDANLLLPVATAAIGFGPGATEQLYRVGNALRAYVNGADVAAFSSTGLAVTGTLSATSGSGNAVIMNHTNSGAVGNPVQRSGVTKGYLGLDVSDNFGLLDSAGTLRAAVSTAGLAVTGTLSATGLASFGTTTKLHAYEAGGGFNYFTNASNGVGNGIAVDATSSYIVVGGNGVAVASSTALTLGSGVKLLPTTDNTQDIGAAATGFKEIFADNGTINTSDARRKTEVSALSAAEINASKQLAKEIGSFKFLSAVAEKGDAARLHIGMTVQRAIEIMEGNGLDPFAYSFICHDAWGDVFVDHPAVDAIAAQEAVLDEDGNVITPAVDAVEGQAAWTEQTQVAGDKYSFRVHELLLFMSAGFEARLSALEAA